MIVGENRLRQLLVGQPCYMSRSDNGVHDCPELFYVNMRGIRQQRRRPNIRRRKKGAALSIFLIPYHPKYTNTVKRSPAVLRTSTDAASPRLVTALAVESYRQVAAFGKHSIILKNDQLPSHARLRDSAAIPFL
ncbi:hypothetical protein HOY80DRAFT_1111617 [Tuber brumale]|nr:hypothetical protein HOY80DRAFT_1111617 [Tuber brumale]